MSTTGPSQESFVGSECNLIWHDADNIGVMVKSSDLIMLQHSGLFKDFLYFSVIPDDLQNMVQVLWNRCWLLLEKMQHWF